MKEELLLQISQYLQIINLLYHNQNLGLLQGNGKNRMSKGNQSLYPNSLSDSFKKSFLIKFTRELIKNSIPKLEQKISEPRKIIEEFPKQIVQEQKKGI